MHCLRSRTWVGAVLLVLCSLTVHAQFSVGGGYEYSGQTYGGVTSASRSAPWHAAYAGLEGYWPRGWLNMSLDARMLRLLISPAGSDSELPGFGIGFQGSAYAGVWLIGRDVVTPTLAAPDASQPEKGVAVSANVGAFLTLDVFVMPLPWIGIGFGPAANVQILVRLGPHLGLRVGGGVQYDIGRWAARRDTITSSIVRDGLIQPFASAGMVIL